MRASRLKHQPDGTTPLKLVLEDDEVWTLEEVLELALVNPNLQKGSAEEDFIVRLKALLERF